MERDQVVAGRYQLRERLGAGELSAVWRAWDQMLGRDVALKLLDARPATDPGLVDRIGVEARAVARLRHRHVAEVYDFGEAAAPRPVPFVVMELVDGLPLSELLAQGALHWRTAVQIGAEVASALAAAHARGILHGNLSPGNVMVTPAGVKVVDFGISASAFVSADGGPAGPVVQADGGAASDVQALGELLYASLTGRTPTAEAGAEVCAASLAVPGLPPATAELCLRCLAAEPADRPFAATVAERLTAPRGTADGSLVGPRNRHPNAAGPHAGAPARLGNRGRS